MLPNARPQWLNDLRWAFNVMRARRWRRKLIFSARMRFDVALKPETAGAKLAYPDAFYEVTCDDLCRAIVASKRRPPP